MNIVRFFFDRGNAADLCLVCLWYHTQSMREYFGRLRWGADTVAPPTPFLSWRLINKRWLVISCSENVIVRLTVTVEDSHEPVRNAFLGFWPDIFQPILARIFSLYLNKFATNSIGKQRKWRYKRTRTSGYIPTLSAKQLGRQPEGINIKLKKCNAGKIVRYCSVEQQAEPKGLHCNLNLKLVNTSRNTSRTRTRIFYIGRMVALDQRSTLGLSIALV